MQLLKFGVVVKYIGIIAGIVALAALALIPGAGRGAFAVGLLCGVGTAVLNLAITYRLTDFAAKTGNKSIVYIAPFAKIIIYVAAMFAAAAMFGLWGAIGAALGCLAGPVAVIAAGVAAPWARRRIATERGLDTADADGSFEYIYEEHIRSGDGSLRYVFARGAYIQSYSGGRCYVTHRRFRKLKEVRPKNAFADIAVGGAGSSRHSAGSSGAGKISENSERRPNTHG
jgi:hypothetical protein